MLYLDRTHNKKGFTLIELLVVIAIIGLLASIVLASLNTARAKARDTRRIEDLTQVRTALEEYYNDNGYYPIIIDENCDNNGWNDLRSALTPKYIASLPNDPVSGSYMYCSDKLISPQEYVLGSQMELGYSVPTSSAFRGIFWTQWGGDDVYVCSINNEYCLATCNNDALDVKWPQSYYPPNCGTYWN